MSRVLGEVADRVGEEVQVERGALGPVQFWRGQSRYLVGELLDSWVETAPWWQRDAGSGRAPRPTWSPPRRCGGWRRCGPGGRGRASPGSTTCPGTPPATAGGSSGCTTDGRRPSRARRSAAPAPGAARRGRPAPRPGPPRARRGHRLRRSPAAVRHRAPGCAAGGRRRAGRPHPARGRPPPAAQRLGAARPGRARAGGVGHLLRRRCRQAGRGRGRAVPRGHRAGGRRPGPRRRRLPRRGGELPRRSAPAPSPPFTVHPTAGGRHRVRAPGGE